MKDEKNRNLDVDCLIHNAYGFDYEYNYGYEEENADDYDKERIKTINTITAQRHKLITNQLRQRRNRNHMKSQSPVATFLLVSHTKISFP